MSLQFLEGYRDSESEEDELEYKPPAKRKRPPNRIWIKVKDFETVRDAEEFVSAQQTWSRDSSKHTLDGQKVYLHCSKLKVQNGDQCPAAVYLLYHSDSSLVSLFKTESHHTNHVSHPAAGLSAEMKTFVKDKYVDGITTKCNSPCNSCF